jgi:Domain of unknown function (DUF1841)
MEDLQLSPDDADRRQFVADPEMLAELELALEDLGDRDTRMLVIGHEHPELQEAIEQGAEEVDLGHGPINPRLHLTLHEVIATQLWDHDPPEVWETAARLREAGYERHEILHMLMRPMSNQVWAALHDEQPYDRDRHVEELRALPGSWEREGLKLTHAARHDDRRRKTRQRARAARRRNRRPR